MKTTKIPQATWEQIRFHLDAMMKLYPEHYLQTLIVRNPDPEGGAICVTDEDDLGHILELMPSLKDTVVDRNGN